MKAANQPTQRPLDARLLMVDAEGNLSHGSRSHLAEHLVPGDLLVANDAATIPASLHGIHVATGEAIEVRLAGRPSMDHEDIRQFTAIVFGAGDYRSQTEDRPAPPTLSAGDELRFGSLSARVVTLLSHPRLIEMSFTGEADEVWAALARHGRPIQYAHMGQPLRLWDVWTRIAGKPVAFEPPSAGFLLDWKLLGELKRRGVGFATITLAAGISSTGEAELDNRLPFDEAFHVPQATAEAIQQTRQGGGQVVALGTTVVRALEEAAAEPGTESGTESSIESGTVCPGNHLATHRIGPHRELRVVDAIISGTHEPGESHYELLRAFTSAESLSRMSEALEKEGYRSHEFGDSIWIENQKHGRQQQDRWPGNQPKDPSSYRIFDRAGLVASGFVPGLSSPR